MRSPEPRVATVVLCTSGGQVLGQLPPYQVAVPWWQDAEALVRGARERFGIEVTVLRLLHAALPEPPGGSVTYLAELGGDTAHSLPLEPWQGHVADHPLRARYATPGGPVRDLDWAASVLEQHRLAPAGAPQQMRTWNLSSLWRLPTEGGALWLKSVPPFLAHEGAILQRLRGACVPDVLAHDTGRVLLLEVPGRDQYDAGVRVLLRMVSTLVDLQVRWLGREEELVSLGLPDWRAPALSEAIDGVVARAGSALRRSDLRTVLELVEDLPRRFAALGECGIDDSLVHGDFAPGNWRGNEERLVLLDWGDSGVGHPLLDGAAFLDRIPPDLGQRVRRHWDAAWRRAVPGCDPQRAADLLAPIAAARQAAVYQRFLDGIEPSEHPYHRADPVAWLGRAARLARRQPRDAQAPPAS